MLRIQASRLGPQELPRHEHEWRGLERGGAGNPYLTFGWVSSWAAVYQPRKLWLLRVQAGGNGSGSELQGIGLVEELPLRQLRFAGEPVTPATGLLCRPGSEPECWQALATWASASTWSRVQARGVPTSWAAGLLTAELRPETWLSLPLPGDFEGYLEALPPRRRRELRRRLRNVQRAGGDCRHHAARATTDAVHAFVRLHSVRAQAKHELHGAIDGRLARMLSLVGAREDSPLRAGEISLDGETIAVTLELHHGGETWAYNTGFDPRQAGMSPGLVARAQSIARAIEEGSTRFDLGPGDFPYKHELGGRNYERSVVSLVGGPPFGPLARVGLETSLRLRGSPTARRLWQRLRSLRSTQVRISRGSAALRGLSAR